MEVTNLLALGQSLAIDTDYELSKTSHSTQLLLRLGDGQAYPEECHQSAVETITVLQGSCSLQAKSQTFNLNHGEQVSVAAGLAHQFLSSSECILLIHFHQIKSN